MTSRPLKGIVAITARHDWRDAVEDIDAVVACLRARGAELVGELERYEDSYRFC